MLDGICCFGSVDGDGPRVRRGRHKINAGIAGHEMGFVLLTAYTGAIGTKAAA